MTTDPRVIIIHGNGGCTAADAWYSWLERELTARGVDVVNHTFPDNVKARAGIWLPHLEGLGADENTVLVGHSSGAVAAMRYAETHRLKGSVLVGVCHTDLGDSGEAASGYYAAPWQWQQIRDNQEWIAIYHSTDDPHIPVAEPRFVAKQLKCSYFELGDRGHFVDAGALPEIVPWLERKLLK
ncbi:MAG TPA: alpha/beta hydrolase [Vicinamibacterales bacterium]|nr:alpha/beta hydrolase [Vicinamibacterales bacterium]